MKLPIKGKDIIAMCSDGGKRHLFRCGCRNENCTDWKCAFTGSDMMVVVKSWVYEE